MMETQMKLNLEWTEDAIQIKTWREFFEKKYPKMFNDSSESEMDIDIDTTMETKPTRRRN